MNADNIRLEKERLLEHARPQAVSSLFKGSFVQVLSSGDPTNGFQVFSFLISQDRKVTFLEHVDWSCDPGDFTPHVECVSRGSGKQEVYYLKHGNGWGAEALYHLRSHANNWPASIEIAEEFRLFFNLFQRGDVFLGCDGHGTEEEVVRLTPQTVEIKLGFLTRYLRAKQMHLAVQFGADYSSTMSLAELGLQPMQEEERDENRHLEYSLESIKWLELRSHSRLIGKAILPCPGPIEWQNPYAERPDEETRFIVGIDSEGKPLERSCRMGKADGGRLTPVFFRRDVLLKYFNEPDKYTVQDGRLSCGGLWGLTLDNDHPKYVIVVLKDLELLPPVERSHWKAFNTTPDGRPSETFATRSFVGRRASAKMPDLVFKRNYPRVNEAYRKRFGWPLGREPAAEDKYVFKQLHVCLTEEQKEFDDQNILLAKLLVDFLNEDELAKGAAALPKDAKGIAKFEDFARRVGVKGIEPFLKFLRQLQTLRSKSVHRKDADYREALRKLGVESLPRVAASTRIFQSAVDSLAWLEAQILTPAGSSRSS